MVCSYAALFLQTALSFQTALLLQHSLTLDGSVVDVVRTSVMAVHMYLYSGATVHVGIAVTYSILMCVCVHAAHCHHDGECCEVIHLFHSRCFLKVKRLVSCFWCKGTTIITSVKDDFP